MEKLDCTGLMCPMPIVRLSKAMKGLEPGGELEIRADDPAFEADVRAWCQKLKYPLKDLARQGAATVARIGKP